MSHDGADLHGWLAAATPVDPVPVPFARVAARAAELRRRRRRMQTSGAFAVAALLAVVVAALAQLPRPGHAAPPADLDVAPSTAPLWLLDGSGNGILLKVDPVRNAVMDSVRLGTGTQRVTVAAGAVWVPDADDGVLIRVDPVTARVVARYRVGGSPDVVLFDGTQLWVNDEKRLVRVDPASGAVLGAITPGEPISGIAYDGRHLWTGAYTSDDLLELDPATGSILARIRVGRFPSSVTFDGTDLWVGNGNANTLSEVDPASARVIRTVVLGRDPDNPWIPVPTWVIATGTTVWAVHLGQPGDAGWSVAAVDARTGEIRRQVPVGSLSLNAATDGRNVWLQTEASVERIDATTYDVTETRPDGVPAPTP